LCTLLIAACASKPNTPAMPSEAQAIINSPQFAHGSWSWDAVELGSGKTLFASNENQLNFLGSAPITKSSGLIRRWRRRCTRREHVPAGH
jgi:hypothetical protein